MARSAQSWCDPHSKHGNASGERPPTSSRTNSRSLIWAVSVNTISAASRKRTAYPIGRFGPVKERTPEVSNLGGASGRREPAENPRDRSQRRSNFHHHAAAILTRWILRSCRFTTDSRLPLVERLNYSTRTPGMARVARSCWTWSRWSRACRTSLLRCGSRPLSRGRACFTSESLGAKWDSVKMP